MSDTLADCEKMPRDTIGVLADDDATAGDARESDIALTVSIVNTNNKALLERCLMSIEAHTRRTVYEVIVVDNASTDGSVEMMRERFPRVRILRMAGRKGYGYCHNRAWEVSRGEYFLVFNEDMYVFPGALDDMVRLMDLEADIGALGGKLKHPDGRVQGSVWEFPTVGREMLQNLVPMRVLASPQRMWTADNTWAHDAERDADVILGACMLLRRSAIERVGLFDEGFFIYSEEVDLCRRLCADGWRVHFTPSASMVHYGAQSTKTMPVMMKIVWLQSKFRYFRKHHGRLAEAVVRLSYIVGLTLRWAGWRAALLARIGGAEEARNKALMYGMSVLWMLGLYKPEG